MQCDRESEVIVNSKEVLWYYVVYKYCIVMLIKQLLNLFKSAFWLKSYFRVTFFVAVEQNCHEA